MCPVPPALLGKAPRKWQVLYRTAGPVMVSIAACGDKRWDSVGSSGHDSGTCESSYTGDSSRNSRGDSSQPPTGSAPALAPLALLGRASLRARSRDLIVPSHSFSLPGQHACTHGLQFTPSLCHLLGRWRNLSVPRFLSCTRC